MLLFFSPFSIRRRVIRKHLLHIVLQEQQQNENEKKKQHQKRNIPYTNRERDEETDLNCYYYFSNLLIHCIPDRYELISFAMIAIVCILSCLLLALVVVRYRGVYTMARLFRLSCNVDSRVIYKQPFASVIYYEPEAVHEIMYGLVCEVFVGLVINRRFCAGIQFWFEYICTYG